MYTVIVSLGSVGKHERFSLAYKQFFEKMQVLASLKVTVHFVANACWVEVDIPDIPPRTKLYHDDLLAIGKTLGVVPFHGDTVPLPRFTEENAKQEIVKYVQSKIAVEEAAS